MKYRLLILLIGFLSGCIPVARAMEPFDTSGNAGRISIILGGIKKEEINKATAETELSTAQTNMASQKPVLEKQRDQHKEEAQRIFDAHDGKHVIGSAEYNYWQGRLNEEVAAANSAQNQLDELQKAVDNARQKLTAATDALEDLQQQLKEISSVPDVSWDCFFDGKCNDYDAEPEKRPGFVAIPNGPMNGAPGIFTPLSEEYKNRHNPDKNSIPSPVVGPPQKGYIRQATDKVKEIFNNVIKRSQQFKTRRVANSVLAVRG